MSATPASAAADIDTLAKQVAARALAMLEDRLFAIEPAVAKPLPRFVLISEAAKVLGFTVHKIRRLEKMGSLPPRRVTPSGRTGYFEDDLLAILAQYRPHVADVEKRQKGLALAARTQKARKHAAKAATSTT